MQKNKTSEKNHWYILKFLLFVVVLICVGYVLSRTFGKETSSYESPSQETISLEVGGQTFSLITRNVFKKQSLETTKENELSFCDFLVWIGIRNSKEKSSIVNESYLEKEIVSIEKSLDLSPGREGSVSLEEGEVVTLLPQEGYEIDQNHLTRALTRLYKTKESQRNYTVFARIVQEKPKTSEKELKAIAENIRIFLSRDFLLTENTFAINHTIPKQELPEIIRVGFNPETKKQEISLEKNYLQEKLLPFQREMRNADFSVDENNTVTIVPSQTGISVDVINTEKNIVESIKNQEAEAQLVLLTVEPELSTEEAEDLNINHLVSSFTTYFACCEARAQNIEAVADIVDGALIYPDEEWNLNTFIGKRTPERGFLPAGTIVKGTMIETTGGGISQFATTFYNTLYWGGFQDVSHTPHSRYFPRYPEGIEATISWPLPHLIFKNNTDNGILVKTKTGSTYLTVQFFSDNDGRTLQGKHKDGKTTITVIEEGGENAKIVESLVDNKTEIYPPKEVYYVDPLVLPNAIFVKSAGRPSYSVDVTRTIKNKRGEILETKKWKTFYLSEDKEYLVKDCTVVPEGGICKTQEDIENEKNALEEFFAQLEMES